MDEKKELKVEDIKGAAQAKACPVQKALHYVTGFLEGPMCGKCFPCSMGSFEARRRLENIAEGRGTGADESALRRIAGHMLEASMCKKGKDTARFILEWIEDGGFSAHVSSPGAAARCPEKQCLGLIEFRVVPEKCSRCGVCKDACAHGAVFGEKRKPYLTGYPPFEIRQKRCVKCGDCLRACPEGAIEVADAAAAEPVKA